jgi:hypothetical protein
VVELVLQLLMDGTGHDIQMLLTCGDAGKASSQRVGASLGPIRCEPNTKVFDANESEQLRSLDFWKLENYPQRSLFGYILKYGKQSVICYVRHTYYV